MSPRGQKLIASLIEGRKSGVKLYTHGPRTDLVKPWFHDYRGVSGAPERENTDTAEEQLMVLLRYAGRKT